MEKERSMFNLKSIKLSTKVHQTISNYDKEKNTLVLKFSLHIFHFATREGRYKN